MKIYNPTYGVMLEVNTTRPDDTKANMAAPLTATSPRTTLTSQEIHSLNATGMVGVYPDAFYTVGSPAWPLKKVVHHQQAVQAFTETNMNGPPFTYWTREPNSDRWDRIIVDSPPGPVVDMIFTSSTASAIEQIYRTILSSASPEFGVHERFQTLAREHAHRLVWTTRTGTPPSPSPSPYQDTMEATTQRTRTTQPTAITRTHPNRNPVKRGLQRLFKRKQGTPKERAV